MRTYKLYLIEDEFASHYFGRERIFFQLFQEYHDSFGELATILTKQIEYITKPIPSLRLHQYINQQFQKRKDFHCGHGAYYIENGKYSTAKLEIFDKHLIVQAQGSYDAETVFFEVLRKLENSFMAVDLEHQRYGWLKPIKERNFG